jgi:hypothetical protein
VAPGERLTAAPGTQWWWWWSLVWWCWFDVSFGVDNCDQGGGELRCIGRNLAPALSMLTTA